MGQVGNQLGQGGPFGAAAHAINPTLGKAFDMSNRLGGNAMGGVPSGLLSPAGMTSQPAMMAPQPTATSQAPHLTTGPSSPAQMAPQSPATTSPFGNISPQLLRLIQMLGQQGISGLPMV